MLYKTEGIIIKKNNLGEWDRLLTVYTRKFGKILLKAKSIRKNQAKLKGHLELFNHTHLMIASGKKLDIITGAETINNFSAIRQNLQSLASVYYILEMVDGLIAGSEKDLELWRLFIEILSALDKKQPSSLVLKNFEKRILKILGYGDRLHGNTTAFIESILGRRLESLLLLQKTVTVLK